MFITITIALSLVVLLVANVAATLFVARSINYTRQQKIAQSCVVWCVPILGAMLVFAVLRSARARAELRSNHIPETNDIGRYLQ